MYSQRSNAIASTVMKNSTNFSIFRKLLSAAGALIVVALVSSFQTIAQAPVPDSPAIEAKAKEMLRDPNFRVGEIAAGVNLGSVSNFIKIFKKHEGVSPSEYRDMCRG